MDCKLCIFLKENEMIPQDSICTKTTIHKSALRMFTEKPEWSGLGLVSTQIADLNGIDYYTGGSPVYKKIKPYESN